LADTTIAVYRAAIVNLKRRGGGASWMIATKDRIRGAIPVSLAFFRRAVQALGGAARIGAGKPGA
jgi:hypothetical protein